MENPRIIGHIVAVQGFRVKVELLPEARSALRATLDGVQIAVAINSYLTFSLGAGQLVIGIITDLEARESYDPTSGDDLTLELVKPRRVASVQLLGTIEHDAGNSVFSPGITILPTLDTPAEIGAPEILKAVFETPPRRNRPDDFQGPGHDYDHDLRLGHPTGQPNSAVNASYNDIFSRPLAIVGNTGSGKSYSVSSLIQKAMKALGESGNEPHIFILDINGEYGRAFRETSKEPERRPDRIYLDGSEFGVPLWLLNAEEICAWLSAAEQTQEPVLKDWWAIAKAGQKKATGAIARLQGALSSLEHLMSELSSLKRKSAPASCDAVIGFLAGSGIDVAVFQAEFATHRTVDKFNTEVVANAAAILDAAEALAGAVRAAISAASGSTDQLAKTADSPLFVARSTLTDPTLVNRAVSKEDTFRVEAHLTTLKLRLKTRLDDRRWRSFLNYEDADIALGSLTDWLERFGLGAAKGPRACVIDLSMLSHEVLPYACSVLGRILLEAREALPAAARYKHPWVLVLEEAHNYARPARSDEDRGQKLSRLTFERIAKEGRKFGLSLIIASQRPSEISATIISQCANFISHRLQNPDDIDHFRRIIPMQARRLLDQVTILASGEAIVFGSAFHIPTRVQFDRPVPGPWSQTAAPYHEWRTNADAFPLKSVVEAWIPQTTAADAQAEPPEEQRAEEAAPPEEIVTDNDMDDEIPF
jgi:DNA helicase HerA-like ATPase